VKLLVVSVALIGVLYSLQALGFVLVIRGTGVLNFAQGQMLALGGYLFYDFVTGQFGSQFVPSLVAMLLVSCVLGVLIYRLVLARMEGAPPWAVVMALFGVGAILDALIQIRYGADPKILPTLFGFEPVHLAGGLITNRSDLFIFVISTAFIAALLALVYLTPLGLRMRASAENKDLAAYTGIRVKRIATISWGLSSFYVALAGLAIALRTTVSPELELAFLTAFPAVVLGGFESIVGAVVGSFLLAIILQIGVINFGSPVALPLAYLVLLLVLMLRPQGLFGARDIIRI
jgi:branched-chain amino acid transport system permease protein